MDEKQKRQLISAVVTLFVSAAVVCSLFIFSLPYPDPPPPEEGVEMNMEELSDIGNDFDNAAEGGEDNSSASASDDSKENTVTQDIEDTPVVSKKKESEVVKKTEEPTQPAVNPNALFAKGKVKKGDGGSSGISQGSGTGAGGNGDGKGVDFNLGGRGAKTLVPPTEVRTEPGKIVVEIMVDKEGNVVNAKAGAKGTNITNSNLYRKCEQAARKCKFAPDPNAPEVQRGTITYRFV